jgi:hypothetical protein
LTSVQQHLIAPEERADDLAHSCRRRANVLAVMCILLGVCCGLAMVLAVTHQGPGLTPDSTAYVQAARSLVAGTGFQHFNGSLVASPQTHFAPLFSIVLAGLLRAGATFEQGSRWLNAALFAVNCVLLALVLSRCVDRRHAPLGAMLGGLFAGLSPVLIHVHAMVWSEPLFLVCMLGSFLLVGVYIDGGTRAWLVGGAMAAALAFLTRYAGASIVIGVAAALMERGPSGRKRPRRMGDAVLFCLIACAPMAGWFVRNIAASRHATDRAVAFHPPLSEDFHQAMISLSDWILPTSERPKSFGAWPGVTAAGAGLMVIIALAAFLTMMKHRDCSHASRRCGTVHLLLWFAPLYLVFVLTSMTWFDASTELDFRILCPLYVAMMPLIATSFFVLASAIHARNPDNLRWILLGGGLLMAFEIARAAVWAVDMRPHGLGYSTPAWQNSGLIALARKLPGDALIYSNAPDALYLLAGRLAKPIPKLVQPGSREDTGTSAQMLKLMQHDLKVHLGYVLYFSSIDRNYFVAEDRLRQAFKAKRIYSGSDGTGFMEKPPTVSAPSPGASD